MTDEQDIDKAMADELAAELASEPEEAPPSHLVLSNKEVEEAKAKARENVEKARKAAATKALIADETLRLEREEGLVSGDPVKDERVNITIDLPEYSNNITVNMEPYWHGQTYNVPRHVANSLREQMQRAWNHQDEIDGKTLAQNLQQRRDTKLTPVGAVNPPQVPA